MEGFCFAKLLLGGGGGGGGTLCATWELEIPTQEEPMVRPFPLQSPPSAIPFSSPGVRNTGCAFKGPAARLFPPPPSPPPPKA